ASATVAGAFYLVDEASSSVTSLGNGDPNSASTSTSDTVAPTITISSPAPGSALAAGLVSISIAANDNVGVSRVELWVQGQLVGTTNAAPYEFNWDASNLTGNVTLVGY